MSDDVQKLILGGSAILLGIAGFLAGGGEPKDLDPIGLSPTTDLCPIGWQDSSVEDEHAISYSCTRGDWIVWLKEDKKTFSHAWLNDGVPRDFVTDPKEVTIGWPAPSSPPP